MPNLFEEEGAQRFKMEVGEIRLYKENQDRGSDHKKNRPCSFAIWWELLNSTGLLSIFVVPSNVHQHPFRLTFMFEGATATCRATSLPTNPAATSEDTVPSSCRD